MTLGVALLAFSVGIDVFAGGLAYGVAGGAFVLLAVVIIYQELSSGSAYWHRIRPRSGHRVEVGHGRSATEGSGERNERNPAAASGDRHRAPDGAFLTGDGRRS